MLYATVFVAVAALSGFASAQNSTSVIPCCSVPATEVPTSQKSAWCLAEKNTCPELCGGLGKIATGGNTCDSSTLDYTCECKNGTKPAMDLYEQSVPGQMCRFWFDTCINATGTDLAAQFQCKSDFDDKCGKLTSDGEEVSTTTSSSASATASETGATSASATDASMTAASTGGAATAMAIAREYGTPLFAGGMVALFGLAI